MFLYSSQALPAPPQHHVQKNEAPETSEPHRVLASKLRDLEFALKSEGLKKSSSACSSG